MLRQDGSGSRRPPGWFAGRLCTFLTVPLFVVSALPAFAQRGGGHGGSHGGGGFSGSHGGGYSAPRGGSYSGSHGGSYSAPRSGGSYSAPRGGGYSAYRGPGYSASRNAGRYTSRVTGYSASRSGSPGVTRGPGGATVTPRGGYTGQSGTSYHGGSHGSSHGGYHGGYHGGGHPTYHYSHYPHYGGYWYPYYGAWGWGWYPWAAWSGWWWGGPWWGWGWGWWPTVSVVAETGREAPQGAWGIVKTDIEPEEAEVWLDGTYVGTADDFDGIPDFLYLRPGAYKLEFRLANYEPLAVDVSIAQGEYLSFGKKLKLEAGRSALDAFPPASKGTPYGRYFGPDGKPVSAGSGGWIDDEGEPGGIEDRRDRESRPRRSVIAGVDRGRLRFSVTPEDAAIYVDNKYVGVGEDLNGSPRGVIVAAGVRSVTVMRPGFKAKTVEIEAKVGQPVDVVVDLEKQ